MLPFQIIFSTHFILTKYTWLGDFMDQEAIQFPIVYDQDALIDYFYSLEQFDINKTEVKHKDEFNKLYNMDIKGDTVEDFKKQLPVKSGDRKDIISKCDPNNMYVKAVINQLQEKIPDAEIGLVSFFMQRQGEDVPVHRDFPYRKNSLLMIPLYGNRKYNFPKSKAITFYENGGEYSITEPTIIDVMKRHGVKNIDVMRLALHIEIPNLTIEDIESRIE